MTDVALDEGLLTGRTVGPSRQARVAVVIPCWNEGPWVAVLLDAIAAQDRLPDEVLIVDDASTDDSIEVIQRWKQRNPTLGVHVISGSGRGAGAAMNAGIAHVRADIIVRLDGPS